MNNNIEIVRGKDDKIEILGQLFVIDEHGATVFKCLTLERPDKNNEHGVSCYPKGQYHWQKVPASHIPYEHIAILNVPNRSGICIHAANLVTQLEGCTAVGSAYKDINGDSEMDVLNSVSTFKALMAVLPASGILTVK